MLWTLQKYILREMGKNFLLTAIGLVAILALGGGVTNMIKVEGLGALQLLKAMALVLPIALALTLPVAALYSATVTYGRLSADNEFVACRASGININVLLLPTIILSLLSATCTFLFINFLIPGVAMRINLVFRSDIPRLITMQLDSPERFRWGDRYRLYADAHRLMDVGEDQSDRDVARLQLAGVAFVEMDRGEWSKIGTAQQVLFEYDITSDAATLAADLYDASFYDRKAQTWSTQQRVASPPQELPETVPLKVKWLTLDRLLQYHRQPTLFPKVQDKLAALRAGMARWLFFSELCTQFRESGAAGEVHFGSGNVQYVVNSRKVQPDRQDRRPVFDLQVRIAEYRDGRLFKTVESNSAALHLDTSARGAARVYLQADGEVKVTRTDDPGAVQHKTHEAFDTFTIDPAFIEQAAAVPEDELLDPQVDLQMGRGVEEGRLKLLDEVGELERDIIGVLHSRLAFSVSALVLVILGALLGIIFRGAHVLTAFGISFLPSLFVIVMIIMGKQLIDKPHLTMVGVGVVWLGIVTVALGDLLIMSRVLRK